MAPVQVPLVTRVKVGVTMDVSVTSPVVARGHPRDRGVAQHVRHRLGHGRVGTGRSVVPVSNQVIVWSGSGGS